MMPCVCPAQHYAQIFHTRKLARNPAAAGSLRRSKSQRQGNRSDRPADRILDDRLSCPELVIQVDC